MFKIYNSIVNSIRIIIELFTFFSPKFMVHDFYCNFACRALAFSDNVKNGWDSPAYKFFFVLLMIRHFVINVLYFYRHVAKIISRLFHRPRKYYFIFVFLFSECSKLTILAIALPSQVLKFDREIKSEIKWTSKCQLFPIYSPTTRRVYFFFITTGKTGKERGLALGCQITPLCLIRTSSVQVSEVSHNKGIDSLLERLHLPYTHN